MINNKDILSLIFKTLTFAIIALFSVELYVEVNPISKIENSRDVPPLDSVNDVLDSLNNNHSIAYPEIGGMRFVQEEITTGYKFDLFPLGGISNKNIVFLDNTAGKITFVKMDEHGFNNKKELYSNEDVDISLIGNCMWEQAGLLNPYEENIGEILRKKGYEVLNFAKAGTTPILQYAIIKEYVEPIRPKIVLFQIREENIFRDDPIIRNDKLPSQSIIKKYYESNNFSQQLLSKQEAIDSMLINFINDQKQKSHSINHDDSIDFFSGKLRLLKLSNIRNIIKNRLQKDKYKPTTSKGSKKSKLTNIILKANTIVNAFGGKLYLVYQPQVGEFFGKKNKLLAITQEISSKYDIPLIDLNKEVFAASPDPRSLLPFREDPHPNAKANKLTADAIEKRLISDGVLKPK